jgi:hypothetical protein
LVISPLKYTNNIVIYFRNFTLESSEELWRKVSSMSWGSSWGYKKGKVFLFICSLFNDSSISDCVVSDNRMINKWVGKVYGNKLSCPNFNSTLELMDCENHKKKLKLRYLISRPRFEPGTSWIWRKRANHSTTTFVGVEGTCLKKIACEFLNYHY